MRVIHLTHGPGNGVDKACLMTATSMLVGRPEELDKTSCVCPTLRSFIIATNDSIPERVLGELYGPLMWEIVGTKTGDPEVLRQRGYAWADWAVREITPLAFEAVGSPVQAERLRGLRPIVDAASAADAQVAAHAASDGAYTAAYAADAAAYTAAYAAADAAAYATDADDAARGIWCRCPDIIRRVASIGDRRPVEAVLTLEQLADKLA